jgi:hypothetical protein
MTLTDVLALSPVEFEVFVTNLLRKMGFNAETTRLCADGGVDVWASSDNLISGGKLIVQCKRYAANNCVGEPVLRELFGLVHAHGINKGVLLTTSSFTSGAISFARGKPLELIDGIQLLSLCAQNGFQIQTKRKSAYEPWNIANVLQNVAQWNASEPLPYTLRFQATSAEVLNKINIFNSDQSQQGTEEPLLLITYYMAAIHLLTGAVFRPEPTPVDLVSWCREKLKVVCNAYADWRLQHPEEARLEDDERAARDDQRETLDYSLEQFEFLISPLCIKYWWKPSKPGDSLYEMIRGT